MNVLVLTNMVPFVRGGVDDLAAGLVAQLQRRGADAEVMRVPFCCRPAERLVDAMALCRELRVTNADRVIALEFPAYLVPHGNKVVWVLRQFRDAYETEAASRPGGPDAARRREIGCIIRRADSACFAEAQRLFCGSTPLQARLRRHHGATPEILLPPIDDPELFSGGGYGDYILASGRVNRANRQGLLVEAMRHVGSGLRLVIAGPPDGPADADDLRRAAAGLEDRVTLDLRALPRAELAALVNGARAVACVADDEDLLDRVALAAFQAAKPVVTVSDARGLLDFVEPDETGLVVAPVPAALAAAIDSLSATSGRAARLGRAGRARWLGRDVGWATTVERLLS